jgi:N-acetylmuramoyl-L-alanine amidase
MYTKVILYSLLILLLLTIQAKAGREGPGSLDFSIRGRTVTLTSLYIVKNGVPQTFEEPGGKQKNMSPTDRIKEIYVPLDAPDVGRFFSSLGAFYSWSSSGEVLFFYSSGRNIYFDRSSSWWNYRGHEGKGTSGVVRDKERAYINLGDLLSLMNVSLRQGEKGDSIALVPVIDDLFWKEDMNTREFMIHGTAPMESKVDLLDDTHMVLFFPCAESRVQEGERLFIDLAVTVTQESLPSGGVRVTLNFPDSWQGKFMGSRMTGEMVTEMLPRFHLAPGYRYEKVESFMSRQEKAGNAIELTGTGPVQYLWSYSPGTKLLLVDLPLVELPKEMKIPSLPEGSATELRSLYFNKLYGVTRLSITLAEGTKFSFERDKKSPYQLKILFSPGKPGAELSGRDVTGEAENWGTIVLDPGHGGCDSGAVNRATGLLEKEVNLDVALRLAALLERSGWKVVLTRTTDRDVSWANSPDRVELQARVDVAAANSATIFISIHCNASTSSDVRGSSLHWYKDEDYELARALTVSTELFRQEMGIPQRGIVQNNFYVLKYSAMPSLLVEMAHISNSEEAGIFANPGCRQKLAEAIARGVEHYFLERGYKRKAR